MTWRQDLRNLFKDVSFGQIVGWLVVLGIVVAVAHWDDYARSVKNFAIGMLIIVGGLIDETTWYFWVIVIGALLWLRANRKNRQRQEAIIGLLAEIRDKLNPR